MDKPKRKKSTMTYALLFFLASIIILYLFSKSVWIKRIRYPLDYTEHIQKYAAEYSLDPHLVASVIWVESKYRPDAVSRRDARGLMQITPSTGQWGAEKMGILDFDDSQLFDSEMNIRIGCWYLNYLSRQFPDNPQLILASYNGGIGNVKKWLQDETYSKDGETLDDIPFKETQEYVILVLDSYKIYKEIYPSLDLDSK